MLGGCIHLPHGVMSHNALVPARAAGVVLTSTSDSEYVVPGLRKSNLGWCERQDEMRLQEAPRPVLRHMQPVRPQPLARASPIVAQEVPDDDVEAPRKPFELSDSIRGPLAGFIAVVLLSGALAFFSPQLLDVLPASARQKVEGQMEITGPFVFVVPSLVLFRIALYFPAVAEGLGLTNGDIKLSKKRDEWKEWK